MCSVQSCALQISSALYLWKERIVVYLQAKEYIGPANSLRSYLLLAAKDKK